MQRSEAYFWLVSNFHPRALVIVADAVMDQNFADRRFARALDDKCSVKARDGCPRVERSRKENETALELRSLREKVTAFEALGNGEGG